ncbi:MAG TPA: hypothetical protein VF062_17390 [Candidatus Limnocylindrales bacterium]
MKLRTALALTLTAGAVLVVAATIAVHAGGYFHLRPLARPFNSLVLAPVACFMIDRPGGEGPKWYLDRAEFISDHGILVFAKDGQAYLVTFDPATLAVDNTVDRVPYGSSRSNCI